MNRFLWSLAFLGLCARFAIAQVPPVDHQIACESRNEIFGADLQILGRPYWAQVTNSHSDYWVVNTNGTPFGTSGWVQSTIIALFDFDGRLIAQNHFATTTSTFSVLIFGSVWQTGRPGSPIMLTVGQNYYLGVAGGGSVFSDGFNCQMSNDRGNFTGFAQPAPGTASLLVMSAGFAIRRRRGA